jgi:hypothetical protein
VIPTANFSFFFQYCISTGSAILFSVKGKFQSKLEDMTEYTSSEVHSITGTLENVLDNLAEAKTVSVNKVSLPPNLQKSIDDVRKTTNVTALIPVIHTGAASKALHLLLHTM